MVGFRYTLFFPLSITCSHLEELENVHGLGIWVNTWHQVSETAGLELEGARCENKRGVFCLCSGIPGPQRTLREGR